MMQVIRDKAQGIVAWIIVGIVAFVLCFWGVSGYISTGKSPVLAKVNGTTITTAQVDDIYNRWVRMNATQKGFDITQIDPKVIKQQIAMSLANQAAVINGLVHDGMTVSDATVVQAIRSKPELQVDGKFSIELYKQFLQQANIAEAEFENAVREQLLVQQLQLAVLASSFVTPQESDRIIGLRNQTRDFGYTVISAANFQKNARITDAAVEEFYNTHKQQFMVPEKVQVEYVEISLDDLRKQVQVTEQNLQDYYKANQQSFTEPRRLHLRHIMIYAPELSDAAQSGAAKQQLDEVYAQLQKGADFATLAKKYSEDKQSAQNGGDLGWASSNDDYPAAVFALSKKGEFTQPLQSEYGWHIFQLVETKGGTIKPYSEVKAIVLERYKREAAEQMFSSRGDDLVNLAFENPGSLQAASEKLNLPIKTSAFFARDGGSGIAESTNVTRAAFSEEVLNEGRNSDLVRLSDDNYLVLRIKEKQPAHELPLAEAKEDIITYLKRVAARDEAKQIGDELLAVIKQTNNPNKAAAAQKLDWVVKRGVERDSKDINRDLLQRVFALPKPAENEPYTVAGFSLPNGDFAVVAITKVKNGVLESSADSNLRESVGKQIASVEGQLDFAAIQQALIEKANIKYY